MLKKSGDGLILELANNLNENKVNGQTIVKSLELICDSAAFDGGVIYDVDFSGQFCLTEFFTPESFAFCDRLAIDSLAPQERDVLVNKGISFIERDESNTQFEMRLLDIHNAVSLMLTPIVDENCDIYSLLLLFNATSKDTLSAEDFNSISVSLSMLAR